MAYVPLNTSTQSIPLVEQKITQIPPYEDSGVKYQGKFKTQQTTDTYELRGQRTRFYTLVISNGAFQSSLFNRTNPTTKFYCTKMIVALHDISTFSAALGRIHLADVSPTGSASIRFYFYPVEANGVYVFDFADCPRLFEGDRFDFYTQFSFGATEFATISLFGWEEQQ